MKDYTVEPMTLTEAVATIGKFEYSSGPDYTVKRAPEWREFEEAHRVLKIFVANLEAKENSVAKLLIAPRSLAATYSDSNTVNAVIKQARQQFGKLHKFYLVPARRDTRFMLIEVKYRGATLGFIKEADSQ